MGMQMHSNRSPHRPPCVPSSSHALPPSCQQFLYAPVCWCRALCVALTSYLHVQCGRTSPLGVRVGAAVAGSAIQPRDHSINGNCAHRVYNCCRHRTHWVHRAHYAHSDSARALGPSARAFASACRPTTTPQARPRGFGLHSDAATGASARAVGAGYKG